MTDRSGHWASSNRRAELPPDWPARRRDVRRRSKGRCERIIDGQRCTRRARDVDHVDDPHDHRIEKLQDLCVECHKEKTQLEAQAARAALRAKLRRPERKHPGLLN